MKHWARAGALVGVAALALAACSEAPEEDTEESPAAEDTADTEAAAAGDEFYGCMVTDAGGVDDRSFNAAAAAGLERAESELSAIPIILESSAETDYGPNLDELVAQECGLIVSVGFLLAPATAEAAEANADERFALVDSTITDDEGAPVDVPNVKPLLFNTHEASYLAGYLAAGMSESGTVATYGGLNIPSVTIFMDGFVDGVDAHNEANGTAVEVLGWNKETQDGTFAGGFEDQSQGQTIAETFISQGADIILPVAGPVGLGTAAAAEEAEGVSVIWVDSDGFESASQYSALFLTSVLKNIDSAVFDTAEDTLNGEFDSTPYVGTLENDGVGLAPYHDFEDQVPVELQAEIDELREQIISGELVVESPSAN